MNQALYPIDKLEWCTYALFTNKEEKKREYCSINTHKRDANKAQSLEGYLWAVTAFEPGKMQIRCLTDSHIIDIKPPLTIIYVGDGCEAYSNNLFIPAKSELTSTDSSLVRHNYFQKFNEEYQDITRYSLMEDLGIVQLTPKEIAKIPDRLTALPKLQFKELKRRLVEIKQPLNIHSNVSFILVMIGGLILCPIIAYVQGSFSSSYAGRCSHGFPTCSEVCAFVWGIFVRGLRVETFVRVLRSSRCRL